MLQAPTVQKELLLGKEHKGLFLLEKATSVQQATLEALNLGNKKFSVACLSSSELWHQRLGHLPCDNSKM